MGLELEIPVETIREGAGRVSAASTGAFRCAASERGVTVIDDYGHHPTEIRATLAAARACRYAHIHVLFQPHRYTRTHALMDDFARAFHQADTVHVMDIYAASEPPIEGVTREALAERIRAFGHRSAHYAGRDGARNRRGDRGRARPGDAIVTLGAGSVSQAGEGILDETALNGT